MGWMQEDVVDADGNFVSKPIDAHFYGALAFFWSWFIYMAEVRRHDHMSDNEHSAEYKEARAIQQVFCSYILLNYVCGLPVLAIGWYCPGEGITAINAGIRTIFVTLFAIMFLLDVLLVFKGQDFRNLFCCMSAPVDVDDDNFQRATGGPVVGGSQGIGSADPEKQGSNTGSANGGF